MVTARLGRSDVFCLCRRHPPHWTEPFVRATVLNLLIVVLWFSLTWSLAASWQPAAVSGTSPDVLRVPWLSTSVCTACTCTLLHTMHQCTMEFPLSQAQPWIHVHPLGFGGQGCSLRFNQTVKVKLKDDGQCKDQGSPRRLAVRPAGHVKKPSDWWPSVRKLLTCPCISEPISFGCHIPALNSTAVSLDRSRHCTVGWLWAELRRA